jgi:large subunit ribosomal protein L23
MDKQTLLKPRLSEKAYKISQESNVYVFMVNKSINRTSVAKAVEAQFEVKVTGVRITNLPSKPKRSTRAGGRKFSKGTQAGVKKAYVTLKKGDTIPIFAAEDEEKAKTEKLQKQAAKLAKKGKK